MTSAWSLHLNAIRYRRWIVLSGATCPPLYLLPFVSQQP